MGHSPLLKETIYPFVEGQFSREKSEAFYSQSVKFFAESVKLFSSLLKGQFTPEKMRLFWYDFQRQCGLGASQKEICVSP